MACYINNVYKRSWWWGGICARIGGSNKERFSFTYWQNLVDIQPSAGVPPSNSLQHTLAHNHTWKENIRKCLCSLQSWSVGAMVTLVAHLLWQLMGVEDAGHRHLELVFFFLGLAQSCLSLLQEEVWRVLTSKLLQDHTSRRFGNLDSFGCVVLLKPYISTPMLLNSTLLLRSRCLQCFHWWIISLWSCKFEHKGWYTLDPS